MRKAGAASIIGRPIVQAKYGEQPLVTPTAARHALL
jgi:hypothetical protein